MDKHLIWAIAIAVVLISFAVAWGSGMDARAKSKTAQVCIKAGGEWTTVKDFTMGCKK